MASAVQQAKRSPMVVAIFGVFFLINVLLLALALLAAFKEGKAPQLLPEDVGMGVRLLLLVIGFGASWGLGHWMYRQLVDEEISVDESATAALVLMCYLLLVFAGVAFLGGISWIWQGALLIVLSLFTLFGLNRVLGTLAAVVVILIGLIAGAGLFYALS